MRTLIICAAGALALAGCQRAAEDTVDAPAATDAAMEATAADTTSGSASGTSTGSPSSSSGSPSTSGAATAAGDASADRTGTAPADDGVMSGPSPAVRDAAKEKAEETNLHPGN